MPRFDLSYEDEEYDEPNNSAAVAMNCTSSSNNNSDYSQHLYRGNSDDGHFSGGSASRSGAAAAAGSFSTSPSAAAYSTSPSVAASASSSASTSVCLSCLDPDGKSWHSLIRDRKTGVYMIESNIMMISSAEQDDYDNEQETSLVILTPLPHHCQSVFRVDAPCELLCVGGGGGQENPGGRRWTYHHGKHHHRHQQDGDYDNDEEQHQQTSLASLCIYTNQTVFLLDIVYNANDTSTNNNIIQGQVHSMTEPFERHLLDTGSYSTRIVRVRAAPQRNNSNSSSGVALHCPSKCMAMLTENCEFSNCLYQLVLHESNGNIKVPLSFSTEQGEHEDERIIDFCFAQCCNGLSLLASLSVLLVKGSGDVLAATPIVFDGSIVPRPDFQQAIDYIQAAKNEFHQLQQNYNNPSPLRYSQEEQELQHQTAAKWRQCRAAERYLVDVFPCLDARSYFLTAKTTSNAGPEAAASWPVQIQGPVLFHSQFSQEQEQYETSDDLSTSTALTIESFGNTEIVGFAVGRRQAAAVDFGVLSPTVLIPRFQLEARRDTYAIDDDVFRYSSWVERVALGIIMDNNNNNNSSTNNARRRGLCLLRDAAVDSFLHVVMSCAVCTISTNAVEMASRHLMRSMSSSSSTQTRTSQVKTTAWTCLTTTPASGTTSIHGAVVTDSAASHGGGGHLLLVRLADGSITVTNIDEQRYAHDLANMAAGASNNNDALVPLSASSAGGGASSSTPQASLVLLERLDAIPPFYESVQPLVKQIQSGLASMGKIVGSETNTRDITPDTLAVAVAIKERCEKQIVLPMMQLQKLTNSRRVALQQMAQTLQHELESLLTVVTVDMHDRTRAVCARMRAAEVNSLTLSQRSQAAMQASQSLGPVITQAEYDFFKFVDLTQAKCETWERKAKGLEARAKRQTESLLLLPLESNNNPGIDDGNHQQIQLNTCMDHVDVERFRIVLDENGEMLKQSRKRLQETERRIQELIRKAGGGGLQQQQQQETASSSSRENQSSTGNAR